MDVTRSATFKADVAEHYLVIARHQPAAADRFASAVELLVEALGEYPMHGRAWESSYPSLADIRVRKVPGFDILIFYKVEPNEVYVMHALHGSRGDLSEVLADE